jgi:peptide-methionine (R)-S-oxide reductase
MRTLFFTVLIILLNLQACTQREGAGKQALTTAGTGEAPLPDQVVRLLNEHTLEDTVAKTEEEWRATLSPAEFEVLRENGTELPFENEYNANKKEGIYSCAACGNPMFSSQTKFESGTGWPSFYAPVSNKRVKEVDDRSLGMLRTEVVCARCASHIGHVFPDGPEPTGLRYCLNSVALDFKELTLD